MYDRLDYCASMKNLEAARRSPNFKFVRGDIRSLDFLTFVLSEEKVDTVLHFAAQTHVDNSFGNSLRFTLDNVYGTHVLLEACRIYGGVRRLVNVSTDEVYGEQSHAQTESQVESSTLEPTNPYAAAKAGAEMLVKAYGTSYGLPCITTRGNNVYGPGQFPEKLIPKFAILARNGSPLPVHGSGESTRSFIHIDDAAAAYDLILHKGVTGETYNIGSRRERSVLDVARDIRRVFDEGLWDSLPLEGRESLLKDVEQCVQFVEDRRFNDRRYFIDDKKLKALGWEEEVDWEVGLKLTVCWYLHTELTDYWEKRDIEAALQAHPKGQNLLRSHSALNIAQGG